MIYVEYLAILVVLAMRVAIAVALVLRVAIVVVLRVAIVVVLRVVRVLRVVIVLVTVTSLLTRPHMAFFLRVICFCTRRFRIFFGNAYQACHGALFIAERRRAVWYFLVYESPIEMIILPFFLFTGGALSPERWWHGKSTFFFLVAL